MVDICENKISGHHSVYFNSLLKLKGVNLKFVDLNLYESKKNIFFYLYSRKKLLNEYLKSKEKVVHILTSDFLYILPLIRKLYNPNKKILCTIHHIPNSSLKKLLLKNFSKKINSLIVHSKYLKIELNKIGIHNVEVINYPSFYNYDIIDEKEAIKKKYNISNDKKIISLLGGTRRDKGLDILLKSFNYLNYIEKSRIILNIAGAEEFFNKNFILHESKGLNIKLDLKNLTEEEFCENVMMTDIMVMPYRKTFSGNSGPMTEAIVNEIPCIAPKELNIGKIVFENNLGEVFNCENPKDLALQIKKILKNEKSYYTNDFHKSLTEENFLKSYLNLYLKFYKD